MANNFSAFFETLVAGADEYNKAKVGQTALLDAVYKDVKPEAARIGKTVDVYFPDFGPLSNIGNGILTGQTVTPNFIPLVFQNRAGAALQFQDFEQWQTAVDLAQKFFDPLYKRAREFLNGQLAALITPANFNANAPIIGAIQGEVRCCRSAQRLGLLADQKVPLDDSDKLHLLVHNRVYQKMLGDAGVGAGELSCGGDRDRGPHQGAAPARFQLPARVGSADADRVGLDPLRPGQPDGQLRDRDGAQHQLHHGGCRRYQPGGLLPGVRQRYHQDSVQGHGGQQRYQPDLEQRHPDYPGGLGQRHHDGPLHPDPGPHLHYHGGQHVGHDHLGRPDQRQHRPVAQLRIRHQRRTGSNLYQITNVVTTTVTLASPIQAADAGTVYGTVQGYTNLALHEYAIALALRPIATPDESRNVVDVSYIDLMGIPLRVMVSYVHIYQALFVTVDFGYALGVIRPDFGVIINC